ncbi:MAG: hypothetical protein VX733_04905 [Candidatus Latescibacterota bacterium]|nr:hypothetical protein [Candidatus Latescibacterota bacterium]
MSLSQGPGATDLIVSHLRSLGLRGVPGHQVLLLLPQRDRRNTYRRRLLQQASEVSTATPPESLRAFEPSVELTTYYGFATRMVRLFWPDVATLLGFRQPDADPVMLTYETAQYLMRQVIAPRIREGFFDGLSLRPQRILSQLLDNLNKAAVNGYDATLVGGRLRDAWAGETDRLHYFDQAQVCIEEFREYCLRHNLVDVSLVVSGFDGLAASDRFQAYLNSRFRHLVVEGMEETVPVAHDWIRRMLGELSSCLLVEREDGGYRTFMGVDPASARELRHDCDTVLDTAHEWPSPTGAGLATTVSERLKLSVASIVGPVSGLQSIVGSYRAEMIDLVAAEVRRLIREEEVGAGDIAIVAPHADGVLRFLLSQALRAAEVDFVVVRRFESLREEPEVRASLALAALAHTGWSHRPHPADVAEAFVLALRVDRLRALLLTRWTYDESGGYLRPLPVDHFDKHAERLGSATMERYEMLRQWLKAAASGEEIHLDHFFRRLFGEVMSGVDVNNGSARLYARLIDSAKWFRQASLSIDHGAPSMSVSERYMEMVSEGIVAAAYENPFNESSLDSVLLVSPVHTYLMEERRSLVQFWLDLGSIQWWEPPHQPLTNPHVLARRWPVGQRWTDAMDYAARNRDLERIVRGLCMRAMGRIYLCWCAHEAAGQIQDSPLLSAVSDLVGQQEA